MNECYYIWLQFLFFLWVFMWLIRPRYSNVWHLDVNISTAFVCSTCISFYILWFAVNKCWIFSFECSHCHLPIRCRGWLPKRWKSFTMTSKCIWIWIEKLRHILIIGRYCFFPFYIAAVVVKENHIYGRCLSSSY